MNNLLMNYMAWLLGLSVLVAAIEQVFPARQQKIARKWVWSDVIHLFFNGHFLGLMLYSIAFYSVLPNLDVLLADLGLRDMLYFNAMGAWSVDLIWQSALALVVLDFIQWSVHNTLHRSNFLWKIHQVHHSVKEGEMDWIVSFRFSWLEPVIYKSAMYLPIMWFGFAPEALFFHAVFGTLIGHLNHANVTWDYGPLGYILNNPKMHLYHHAFDAPATGQNFGIIFSFWDYIFSTAHVPDEPCPKIGFPGVEKVPNDFFGQLIWPLHLLAGKAMPTGTTFLSSTMGLVVLGGLYAASLPPSADASGEPIASSQPTGTATLSLNIVDSDATREALLGFGLKAKSDGQHRPEFVVHASELAPALGASGLLVLDVRSGKDASERFTAGHIPTAQLVERKDYSGGSIPGLSKEKSELMKFLRARGAQNGGVIVITGDGGPEPHRLWWTLREVAGVEARVLEGGLAAWKSIGAPLSGGQGKMPSGGNIEAGTPRGQNLVWSNISELKKSVEKLSFVDTRSDEEFLGKMTHRKSTRAGHIPGAVHLDWTEAFKLNSSGVPILKSEVELREMVSKLGVEWGSPLVTYCQSGTRSAAVFFALMQRGYPESNLWNYDGSWAEYSRTDEPVEM